MIFSLLLCLVLKDFVRGETGERAVRLTRSGGHQTTYSSGIVEIYHQGSWGTICEDVSFGEEEADVVCHQLTFTGVSDYRDGSSGEFGIRSDSPLVENVSCSSGNFLSLAQCSLSSQYSDYCSPTSRYVVIDCYVSRIWDSPFSGQIRLTGGSQSNQGLLEVYCNGQWGTVCDDDFEGPAALVACRQLGYNTYYSYDQLTVRGNSSQKIWLDEVQCASSTFNCLSSCEECPSFSSIECVHYEDITLDCGYSSTYHASPTVWNYCSESGVVDESSDSNGPDSDGAIRLTIGHNSSKDYTTGRVQVWIGGVWNTICDDSYFGNDEADVICHQLGRSGASSYSNTGDDGFGNDIRIRQLSCNSSSYLTIFQCSFSTDIRSSCTSYSISVSCYSERIWDNPYSGQIRLSGGEYSNQGLLEVYCNGQWGTVCDDDFDTAEANVVCRQLGYSSYYRYDHLSITGRENQPIWLDDVSCSSSCYNCLSQCQRCPSFQFHDCIHSEDITIECGYSELCSVPFENQQNCSSINAASAGPRSIGAMRLLNQQGSTSLHNTVGLVQVWYNGRWGTICDDSYFAGYMEADVICHQLGWSGASSYSTAGDDGFNSEYELTISELFCSSSSYLTIFQCSFSTYISSSCTSSDSVSVSCYSERIWDTPFSGQIRLSRGNYSNQGLLEVYCNGQWGTVCDDGFDLINAGVVCRQLGYSSTLDQFDHLPIVGNGSQPIWLDDVSCSSSRYNCLSQCQRCQSYEHHDCIHFEDVTIECTIDEDRFINARLSTCEDFSTESSTAMARDMAGVIAGVVVGVGCLIVTLTVVIISIVVGIITHKSILRHPRITVVGTTTGTSQSSVTNDPYSTLAVASLNQETPITRCSNLPHQNYPGTQHIALQSFPQSPAAEDMYDEVVDPTTTGKSLSSNVDDENVA